MLVWGTHTHSLTHAVHSSTTAALPAVRRRLQSITLVGALCRSKEETKKGHTKTEIPKLCPKTMYYFYPLNQYIFIKIHEYFTKIYISFYQIQAKKILLLVYYIIFSLFLVKKFPKICVQNLEILTIVGQPAGAAIGAHHWVRLSLLHPTTSTPAPDQWVPTATKHSVQQPTASVTALYRPNHTCTVGAVAGAHWHRAHTGTVYSSGILWSIERFTSCKSREEEDYPQYVPRLSLEGCCEARGCCSVGGCLRKRLWRLL